MKKTVTILLLLAAASGAATAQDRLESTVSADFVSQYVWRGLDLGGASLQPSLGVSYKGLSLSAWGSTGLTDPADTREVDLTLDYTAGGLQFGVTDYWFNAGPDQLNRYLHYASNSTNHVFEAFAGYDFGPVFIQWFTNFAGADGVNAAGKRAYSSYFEIGIPFTTGEVEWAAAAGAVPFGTDFYGNERFVVTNLSLTASKAIEAGGTFRIPLSAGFVVNPYSGQAFLVFGLTIQP